MDPSFFYWGGVVIGGRDTILQFFFLPFLFSPTITAVALFRGRSWEVHWVPPLNKNVGCRFILSVIKERIRLETLAFFGSCASQETNINSKGVVPPRDWQANLSKVLLNYWLFCFLLLTPNPPSICTGIRLFFCFCSCYFPSSHWSILHIYPIEM